MTVGAGLLATLVLCDTAGLTLGLATGDTPVLADAGAEVIAEDGSDADPMLDLTLDGLAELMTPLLGMPVPTGPTPDDLGGWLPLALTGDFGLPDEAGGP
ncbi:hypothetical protein K493DRAFT_322115 [Basidiobolus meristosporus CBS 931.73]|uniref:Uncharacterized protein n=1 Tax=Basidiobolus meristosporus CBS 931.73 TaxID=1314790 RepID=A0A1Y1VQ68_9FUNG|nr:hypothetical protein K493DRAFT_322115 [Basidiobolus meristosporus CBS 931.73]|eukprot:ORX63452.1 hypothetical protein K493DRAFT_322115 [Basidiobolus meristosporus CBS 931.73]